MNKKFFALLIASALFCTGAQGGITVSGSANLTSLAAFDVIFQPGGATGNTVPSDVASQILTAGGQTVYTNGALTTYDVLIPFTISYTNGALSTILNGIPSSDVVRPTDPFQVWKFELRTVAIFEGTSITLYALSINHIPIDGVWSTTAQGFPTGGNSSTSFFVGGDPITSVEGSIVIHSGIPRLSVGSDGVQLEVSGYRGSAQPVPEAETLSCLALGLVVLWLFRIKTIASRALS